MMPFAAFDLRFEWLNLSIALLLFMVLVPAMLYFEQRRKKPARIRFSTLRNIKPIKTPLKVRLHRLPLWLRVVTVSLLLIAFAHPYQEKEKDKAPNPREQQQEKSIQQKEERKKIEVPSEGVSIQLLIDRSGSMGVQTTPRGRKFNYMKFENALMSKLDVVKIISKRFIQGSKETNKGDSLFSGRGNDLISLTTFARYPFIACPLTLRHELLLDYISQLETVSRQEEDGTYIGYALERAILQVIDAKSRAKEDDAYNIKSSIIVLVTDGAQMIRPEDESDRHKAILPSEAAQLAKDNGIKIYTIAVAPQLIFDEHGTVIGSAGQFPVDEIRTAAEETGGSFYLADSGDTLLKIYQEINSLEKSKLPEKKELEARVQKSKEDKLIETEKIEYFPFFLWAALFTLLCEITLTVFYFRRIP
jgi:Ca-activated chloride channel family protein